MNWTGKTKDVKTEHKFIVTHTLPPTATPMDFFNLFVPDLFLRWLFTLSREGSALIFVIWVYIIIRQNKPSKNVFRMVLVSICSGNMFIVPFQQLGGGGAVEMRSERVSSSENRDLWDLATNIWIERSP